MRYLLRIFVLFCVGGLVWFVAPGDSTPEEDRPHHLVRLTGVVSLHGARVEINELFACWGHHPETGYGPGREILVTRDQRRYVMLADNAVLTISPSTRWCGVQDWLWNDDKEPRPNASDGLRWTPLMSWSAYDPETDTAQGEIMISPTAWNDPTAPLQRTGLFNLAPIYPPPDDLVAAHNKISTKQSALWNEGDLRRRLASATPGFLFTYDEVAWRDPNAAKPRRLGGPKERVAPARQAVLVEALEDPALPPDHLAAFLEKGGLAAWTGCRRDDESKQCAWDQVSPLAALSWGERRSLEAVLYYGIINPDGPIYGRRATAEPGETVPNPYDQNRFDRGYALTCKGGTLGVDFNKKGRANTYSKPCWWPDNFEGFNVNGLGTDDGWDPRIHEYLFNTRTREIWHIVRPA